MQLKNPTVLDLFSGCGGLSFGLSEVGYEVLLGIDNWKPALETFKANHPEAQVLNADISKLTGKKIRDLVKKKVDVVVGGPPCQGFSLSGPRNFHDSRNRLYLDFIRLVRELKPKAFIIENVPGLGSLFGGTVKERILQKFGKMGYKMNAKVVNASDYGVPQNRRRIIFVGTKGKKRFEFPQPSHEENKLTVFDAISDLPMSDLHQAEYVYTKKPLTVYQKTMRTGSKKIYNHLASKHAEQTKKIVALVPEGGNYKDLPDQLRSTRNFHVAWTRLHSRKPSPTIDTGHRHHFHPSENRVPTVREAARIQSFPDRFQFLGTKTSQYKQVGNAVPPLLAAAIGKKLINYL